MRQDQLNKKLSRATWGDDLKAAREALEAGAQVNCGTSENDACTPLFDAAHNGNIEMGCLLIEKGANVNARCDGFTPFSVAILREHHEFATFLLEKGAEIDVQNDRGRTPLHSVVSLPDIESAQYLIDKGANINIMDNKGFTPLDYAQKSELLEMLGEEMTELLVDFDDDLSEIEEKRETSRDYREEWGFVEMEALLLRYGAKTGETLREKKEYSPSLKNSLNSFSQQSTN